VLTAEIFERFTRFLLVVFSARLLGDVEYGKFAFALAFTGLFFILADGGIHQLLMREIARSPESMKKLIGNGLFLKLLLAAFTTICIYVIGQLTGKPLEVLTTVYLIGASEIAASFADFFATVFRATLKMKYDVAGIIFSRVVNTALGIAVLIMGMGIVVLAWVYLISQVLKCVYAALMVHTKFAKITVQYDPPVAKSLVKRGLVFWTLSLSTITYTYGDSILLSFMASDQVVGWYNAAYRLVFAMMFIPMGTMKVIFPALSAYYDESKEDFARLFERTFKVMFIAGFSLATLFFVFAEDIIVTLYGPEYRNAAGALRILVWSTAVIFIGIVMTHVTRAAHCEKFTAKVIASSAVLNILLNFILIPHYSFYGAAVATLASELFTFLFHFRYVTKNLMAPPFFRLAPKVILINAVTCVYVLVTVQVNLLFAAITSVLINLLMIWVVGYFTKKEFAFMLSVLRLSRTPAT